WLLFDLLATETSTGARSRTCVLGQTSTLSYHVTWVVSTARRSAPGPSHLDQLAAELEQGSSSARSGADMPLTTATRIHLHGRPGVASGALQERRGVGREKALGWGRGPDRRAKPGALPEQPALRLAVMVPRAIAAESVEEDPSRQSPPPAVVGRVAECSPGARRCRTAIGAEHPIKNPGGSWRTPGRRRRGMLEALLSRLGSRELADDHGWGRNHRCRSIRA